MLNWDRILFLVLALPVAIYQAYVGWREWRKGEYDAVAGALLLAMFSIAVPLFLAAFGE